MKPADLRKLSLPELEKKVSDLRREWMNLRFQVARSQVANSRKIRVIRRDIARALTIYREKTGGKMR